MAEEVKLYGFWASPYSKRVEIALKLKGINYEYVEEDLINKSPDVVRYNPVYKKIPVFVHNGKPIAESLIILEYIDETWTKNPILPKDPYKRAMARFWAKFLDDKMLQTALKGHLTTGEELKKIVEEVRQLLKFLENEIKENEIKGNEFYGGDSIGYLDIVGVSALHWLQIRDGTVEIEDGMLIEENSPTLLKWLEKVRSVDVVRETLSPMDKHIAFMKASMGFVKQMMSSHIE